MARYVYRQDGSGEVRSIRVSEKPPNRGTPDYMKLGFDDLMLNAYRKAEERGQPLRGPLSATQIKRVHGR